VRERHGAKAAGVVARQHQQAAGGGRLPLRADRVVNQPVGVHPVADRARVETVGGQFGGGLLCGDGAQMLSGDQLTAIIHLRN
jgi:hypothetical protein